MVDDENAEDRTLTRRQELFRTTTGQCQCKSSQVRATIAQVRAKTAGAFGKTVMLTKLSDREPTEIQSGHKGARFPRCPLYYSDLVVSQKEGTPI